MKGASEHFHFLLVLAGTYDDTVRNIDIGRVGYLRHSFIAGFPTERDDGPVHPPGGLPAGDALRNGRVRPGLKTAWHPTRRPGRNQACVRRANFFFRSNEKARSSASNHEACPGTRAVERQGRAVCFARGPDLISEHRLQPSPRSSNCAVDSLGGAKHLGICFTADPSPRLGALRGRHRRRAPHGAGSAAPERRQGEPQGPARQGEDQLGALRKRQVHAAALRVCSPPGARRDSGREL